jgi:hypothetical protein
MNYSFDASVTDNGVDASTMKNGHKVHDNANDLTQTNAPKWLSSVVGRGKTHEMETQALLRQSPAR